MDKEKLQEEFYSMDEDGFEYWLMDRFLPGSSAFDEPTEIKLSKARDHLIAAHKALNKIREEYKIEEI